MATIYFTTDQSGANTSICTTQSSFFNFSSSISNVVSYASFVAKAGSGTTAPIVVTIHDQANGNGNVVATASIAAASVPQTYTAIQFNFPANTALNANQTYSLKITSTTGCGGSSAYFFKAGNFQVYNVATNALLSVGYGVSAGAAAVTTTTAHGKLSAKITSTAATTTTTNAAPRVTRNVSANVSSVLTASASAVMLHSISAAAEAAAAFTAAPRNTMAISAACETLVSATAEPSLMVAGQTNTIAHGASLIETMYVGENRISRAYLGDIVVWSATSVPVATAAYGVSGAGEEMFNGLYCLTGQLNGKDYFKHQSENLYLYWSAAGFGMPFWYISATLGSSFMDDFNGYEVGPNTDTTPPATGWGQYGSIGGQPIAGPGPTLTSTTC